MIGENLCFLSFLNWELIFCFKFWQSLLFRPHLLLLCRKLILSKNLDAVQIWSNKDYTLKGAYCLIDSICNMNFLLGIETNFSNIFFGKSAKSVTEKKKNCLGGILWIGYVWHIWISLSLKCSRSKLWHSFYSKLNDGYIFMVKCAFLQRIGVLTLTLTFHNFKMENMTYCIWYSYCKFQIMYF